MCVYIYIYVYFNTIGRYVGNKYLIGQEIGSGGYRMVYMSTNCITNEEGASNVEWLQEEPPCGTYFTKPYSTKRYKADMGS